MSDDMKKTLIKYGAIAAGFIVVVYVMIALGWGEFMAVGIMVGLITGATAIIAPWADANIPEVAGGTPRSYCYQFSGAAIIGLVVIWRMYPSALTPDFMAPMVSVAELNSKTELWNGHKRRIEGTITQCYFGGSGTDYHDYIDLTIEDDSGTIHTSYRKPFDEPMPVIGSVVRVDGEIDPHFDSHGPSFVVNDLTVLVESTQVAAADED